MKRLLSLLCVLTMVLGMISVPAFATEAETLQDKVNDYTSGVITLTENAEKLTVNANTYIDLNGYSIDGIAVADGVTLYVSDSQTDDYTVADGNYGTVIGADGAVEAMEGYVAVEENGALSFHRVDLTIKSMSFRPGEAGVYYTSSFAADEIVAAQVESYGVALSVAAEPTAENLETLCGYSALYDFGAGEKSGTLLTGIMDVQNDAETNAAYAAMDIYGRAYIKTAEGYAFGTVAVRNLQQQVEAIDAILGDLNDTQKAGITAFYNTYKEAMADWNIPNLRGNQLGDTVITIPVQTEDGVVTETVTVEQDGMSITIPFGVLVEAAQLKLTVTKLDASESDIEAGEGQTLMPFDVHVEGVSVENTVPLTVYLGKVMPENLNMGNYSIYHVEADGTKEMSLVANEEDFAAHNQYKYTLDGELTLHMATFSVVAAVTEDANAWNGSRDYTWYDAEAEELYIRNADQLAGFGAIVGGMDGQTQDSFENKTVKLLSDISIGDLDGDNMLVFYPIGYYNNTGSYEKRSGNVGPDGAAVVSGYRNFEGTFNGNGHTISDFYQNTWEMFGDYNDGYSGTPNHSRDGMGLFGRIYGGTVKNLNVANFSSDGEFATTGTIAAYADCAATFENIAIFECNPRVYNIGNGGIVGCVGWYTKDVVDTPVSFKNITVDNSNKISALWGSWDVACGGLVGQYYPTSGQSSANYPVNAGVHFEYCHATAQIDVYNDVCANYQYYAYRYSGMMIGSIRENITVDGYVYPKMDGITATGCTVHFGDWNDYYYCELVDNSLASYTHDHQMSRLVQVAAVNGTTITPLEGEPFEVPASGRANYVVVKQSDENGFIHGDGDEYAECYHFLNGEVWTHDMGGYETTDIDGDGVVDSNVLKEDKQHIYREFNQLFTGYGWGVTSKGLTDVQELGLDVTVLDRLPASTVKFNDILDKTLAQDKENLVIAENTVLTAGQIFEAAATDIQGNKVQVFVSPADENSTVEATSFTSTAADWTTGTLQFKGRGKATITITDYYFCEPTVITVTVGSVKEAAEAMALTGNGTIEAVCPVCGTEEQWTELNKLTSITSIETGGHYYLSESVENTTFYGFYADACVHLNGKNITSTERAIYVDATGTTLSTLNIMGKGVVTGGGVDHATIPKGTIDIGGSVNFYGGTYVANGNNPTITSRGYTGRSVVNIYDGAEFTGANANLLVASGGVNVYGGKFTSGTSKVDGALVNALNIYGGEFSNNGQVLNASGAKGVLNIAGGTFDGAVSVAADFGTFTVSGEPVISTLDLSSGKLATFQNLTGDAKIGVNAVGAFTEQFSKAKDYLDAGYIVPANSGVVITEEDGVLYAEVEKVYCEHCDQMVEWKTWGGHSSPVSGHYFLSDSIDQTAQLSIVADTDVVLDLRGNTLNIIGVRGFLVRGQFSVVDTADGGQIIATGNTSENAHGGLLYAQNSATTTGATFNLYSGTLKMADEHAVTNRGGLIQLTTGAVMNMYGGIIEGGETSEWGGNVGVGSGDSTFNMYGGEIRNGKAPAGADVFVLGTFNMNGGTVTGVVSVDAAATAATFVNGVKISQLQIAEGKLVDVSGLTTGAEIGVVGNGVFTKPLTNANNYLTYFTNKEYIFVENDALTIKDPIEIANSVHTAAEQMTDDGVFNQGGTVTAVCPVCGTEEQWEDLAQVTPSTLKTDKHYYLSKDVNATALYNFTSNACLHLNGHNMTSTVRTLYVEGIYDQKTKVYTIYTLNIMGKGVVTGGGVDHATIPMGTIDIGGNVNLYGGTIVASGNNPALCARGFNGQSAVNIYDGAEIVAPNISIFVNSQAVNMYGGKVTSGIVKLPGTSGSSFNVYGGTISNSNEGQNAIEAAGAKAALDIAGGVITGKVSVASDLNAVTVSGVPVILDLDLTSGKKLTIGELDGGDIRVTADGAFTDTLTNAAEIAPFFTAVDAAKEVAADNGVLIVRESAMAKGNKVHELAEKMTTDGIFSAGGDIVANCPVCETEVTWKELNAVSGNALASGHYYLSGDLQRTTHFSVTGEGNKVCLHLNGNDITSSLRSFYIEYATLNIMGEGIVTGGHSNANNAHLASNVDASGNVNLFGGTYKATTDKPIVSSRSNKDNVVTMYTGASILRDASAPGLNVQVIDHGDFIMYGGVISGASRSGVDGGANVFVYSRNAYSTVFTMYGGVIENGTADKGGNIYASGTNATVNICGGTIRNGDVYAESGIKSLTVSGMPVISELDLTAGATLTVETLESGADITVKAADGVFSNALAEGVAQSYIDNQYIKLHESIADKVLEVNETGAIAVVAAPVVEEPEIGDGTENGDETTETTEPEA